MKKFVVEKSESDLRLQKYLLLRLPQATSSFCYKMLRKKNITLNGKKADGSERLKEGDEVVFFLSDETFDKFAGAVKNMQDSGNVQVLTEYVDAYMEIGRLYKTTPVIYEDEDILLLHKKPGILSQKARPEDRSMNEWLIGYLLDSGKTDGEHLQMEKPAVCNRLDRNTGGILIASRTRKGSRMVTGLLRDRKIKKIYHMVVAGVGLTDRTIEGFLLKDEKENIVQILPKEVKGAMRVVTRVHTIREGKGLSLIEAELVTGKTHQLRAHLASIGHPIAGDMKYGDERLNKDLYKLFHVDCQMLYAVSLTFPQMEGEWGRLSGKEFTITDPAVYSEVIDHYRA